jgi:DNA polymerase II small subunit/DNA polymerase delta subunit B
MRKLPDRLEISDESLAITYCSTHLGSAVETKKTLIKSEIKRAIVAGSIIPGADIVPGNEELYVVDETNGATEHLKHAAA